MSHGQGKVGSTACYETDSSIYLHARCYTDSSDIYLSTTGKTKNSNRHKTGVSCNHDPERLPLQPNANRTLSLLSLSEDTPKLSERLYGLSLIHVYNACQMSCYRPLYFVLCPTNKPSFMSSGYWATAEQIEQPPKRPPQHWKEKGMLSMQYQLSRRKAVRKLASDRRQDEG
jgi:hypothetical protein